MIARRAVQAAAIVTALLVVAPQRGDAAMAVVDSAAIAKLAEQMNKLQEQLDAMRKQTEWLNTLSTQAQDQINAIGAMGQLTIPSLNLQKLTGRVMRDAQCLLPDFSKLMPELSLEDLQFQSICGGSDRYGQALWFDPDDPTSWSLPPGTEWDEAASAERKWRLRDQARQAVEGRRQTMVRDVATKGMAQADLAAGETAVINQQATEELEAAAAAAQTQQERLAAIAQGQVLSNRQMVQQNQLLAQLLKVQSTMLMEMTTAAGGRALPAGDQE